MTTRKIKKIIEETLREKKIADTDAAVEQVQEYCANTLCSFCRYAEVKQERGNGRMGIYKCRVGYPRSWGQEIEKKRSETE